MKTNDKHKTEMCHDIVWEDLLEYLHKQDLSKPALKAIFMFLVMHPAILHPDNRIVNKIVDNRDVYSSIQPSLTGGTIEVGPGHYPTWIIGNEDPVTALKSRNTREMIVLAKTSMMIEREVGIKSNSASVNRPSRVHAEFTQNHSNSSDSLQNIGTLSVTFRARRIYDFAQLDDGDVVTLTRDSNMMDPMMIRDDSVFVVTDFGGPNEKKRAHLDLAIATYVHIAMQIAGEGATWRGIVNNGHEAVIQVCVPQDVAGVVTDILKEISGMTELAPVVLNVPRNLIESNMKLIAPYTTEMKELEAIAQMSRLGTLPAAPTSAPQYIAGIGNLTGRLEDWRRKVELVNHLAALMPSVIEGEFKDSKVGSSECIWCSGTNGS